MEQGGVKQFFERSQTRQTPLSILGKLVFWLVLFIAITMAVDTLGISAISDVLAQFIAYIPQIIARDQAARPAAAGRFPGRFLHRGRLRRQARRLDR